jgi:hypothetical protein
MRLSRGRCTRGEAVTSQDSLGRRIVRGRLVSSGLFALIIAVAGVDAGAAPRTIARVRSANPSLDERIDAELATLGFAVKRVDAADPGADLGDIARANEAVAALRVEAGDAVEIWVEGRTPGDPPTRETIRPDGRRPNVAAVLALEALRAHLLEVRPPLPSEPVRKTLAPPAPSPMSEPATQRSRSLWFHLGAGADASPGGLPPGANLLLEVRLEARPWLSVAAFAAATPLATRLDAAEGGAFLRRAIAGAGIDLQKQLGRTTLSVGAGGAFLFLFVEGTSPAAGYGARDSSTVTLGPLLRSSAAIELVPPLRVRLELGVGVSFPRATISFADREEATWGRPFGLLTLGLEWGVL